MTRPGLKRRLAELIGSVVNGLLVFTLFLLPKRHSKWAAKRASRIVAACGQATGKAATLLLSSAGVDKPEFISQVLLDVTKGFQAPDRLGGLALATRGTLDEQERFLAPSFIARPTPPMDGWRYQNEVMEWDIEPHEKVLDVGSGTYPFSKATHLADLYLEDTPHRCGMKLARDDRPLIIMDVCAAPFPDKTWDFVFCSHMLEHLENPGDGLREISRIGKRGYIEIPTKLSDVMLNFTKIDNHHLWHGMVLNDVLIFIEWLPQERQSTGSDYFYKSLVSKYKNEFQEYFYNNWSFFMAGLHWKDEVKFLVIDRYGNVIDRNGVSEA